MDPLLVQLPNDLRVCELSFMSELQHPRSKSHGLYYMIIPAAVFVEPHAVELFSASGGKVVVRPNCRAFAMFFKAPDDDRGRDLA